MQNSISLSDTKSQIWHLSALQWSWLFALASLFLRIPGFLVDLPPYQFVDEAIYTNGVYSIALSDWGWAPYNYLAGGINYYLPAIIIFAANKLLHISFDMERVIIWSRLIGPGISSCLAIPLVFITGRQLFQNERLSLLAAGILAFSPFMLEISRIWYPDHYAVIFSTLALYAATCIATSDAPRIRDYLQLGFAIGLSASTKYNGLFFVFLIPIAHGFAVLKQHSGMARLRNFFMSYGPWLAGLSTIVSFLLTNPYLIKHWAHYVDAIQRTREVYLAGSAGLMVANTPAFYSTLLLFTTFGMLGGVLIIAGALDLLRRHFIAAVLLSLMPIIFIGMMSEYKNALDRNISVLIPYAALLLAAGFEFLYERLNTRLFTIIFLLMTVEPFTRIALNVNHDLQPDSRQQAAKWINANIPLHSIIGIGVSVSDKGMTASVDNNKFTLIETPLLPNDTIANKSFCVNYYTTDQWIYQMFGKGKSVFTSTYYSENAFRNIGGYFFKKEHENIVRWIAEFEKIYESKGHYYGPKVYIYKRKISC